MADTNTTITDLLKMETGTHDNDWGTNLNLVLDNIDTMTKATRTTATTGGTTVLTKTTAREPFQRVTGVLISNAIIEIPVAAAAIWWFKNETTGNFTLTVKVNGQTGVVIEQGNSKLVRGNGVDIVATGMPSLADIQTGVVQHATAVAGTVDAVQVTMSPVSTSLTTNEILRWKSAGANTIVAPTMSVDAGVTTNIIKKGASAALAVGDTGASGYECVALYNGVDWILQNPAGLAHVASANTFTSVNTFTKSIIKAKGAAVALAATTNIWTTGDGDTVHISAGTGPLTSFGTAPQAGAVMRCIADVAFTMTYNVTTLQMPSAASIPVAIGDSWDVLANTTANMIVMNYTRASGQAVIGGGPVAQSAASTSGTFIDFTVPSTTQRIDIGFSLVSLSATSHFLIQLSSAGSIISTNYASLAWRSGGANPTSGAGFIVINEGAASVHSGVLALRKITSSVWSLSGIVGDWTIPVTSTAAGTLVGAGTIDRIRITTVNGTDTFDAGTVGIVAD